MKVRPSVKPICEKCKIIKRKGKSWLSVRTPSTSRSKVKKNFHIRGVLINGQNSWN